jgi:hypothetical protein
VLAAITVLYTLANEAAKRSFFARTQGAAVF